MDFEFQNGTGQIDARSPFAQVSMNAQRFPPNTNSPNKSSAQESSILTTGPKLTGVQEASQSGWDSPSKLRTMGSHLSSPSKPLPPAPAFNSLYNTPRKPRDEYDDSSAGETPRSPEQNNDSDATPDNMGLRSAAGRFDNMTAPTQPGAERERSSPTKERPGPSRRESLFGSFATKVKKIYSPGMEEANDIDRELHAYISTAGRGEVPRSEHAGAIEKKRSTRRKREVDRHVARKRRRSVSDSGDDIAPRALSPRKASGQLPASSDQSKPHWVSSLFTFIGQHPTVPHILSFYAQLLFNLFLLCCCGYLIYCFWSAVQGDVNKESWEASADIIAEIAKCGKEYKINECEKATRIPVMETFCDNWAKCMSQDPYKIARARISAHTFAKIFNSFVEPISYKAMIFTFIMVFGCFAISNFVRIDAYTAGFVELYANSDHQAFGFFRNKASEYQPNYGYGYGAPPPPTPQRAFSGQNAGFYGGTPWQAPPGVGFEPQPSGGYGQVEGQGSPVRRLMYN